MVMPVVFFLYDAEDGGPRFGSSTNCRVTWQPTKNRDLSSFLRTLASVFKILLGTQRGSGMLDILAKHEPNSSRDELYLEVRNLALQ